MALTHFSRSSPFAFFKYQTAALSGFTVFFLSSLAGGFFFPGFPKHGSFFFVPFPLMSSSPIRSYCLEFLGLERPRSPPPAHLVTCSQLVEAWTFGVCFFSVGLISKVITSVVISETSVFVTLSKRMVSLYLACECAITASMVLSLPAGAQHSSPFGV